MYELVVIWETGEKNIYPYRTEADARTGERSMRMAFGNQIAWSGIRPKH
jgi:hypothetical protein